jgi:hypothetical protein
MKLQQLKGDGGDLTRTFAYPTEAPIPERFNVVIRYLSPALFTETQEKVKVKVLGPRRKGQEPELDMKKFKEVLASEVLSKAIVKIEGCTIGKLKRLVPLSSEAVKSAGGLDTAVDLDPSGPNSIEAADNVQFLLTNCADLFDFVLEVSTNLAHFQDDDWEKQLGN